MKQCSSYKKSCFLLVELGGEGREGGCPDQIMGIKSAIVIHEDYFE
jgi:hypothetical protein